MFLRLFNNNLGEIVKKNQKQGYTKSQAENYDETRFNTPHGELFNKIEMQHFLEVLKTIPKNGKVLEVGCGTGRFLLKAALNEYDICGVDPSIHMIKKSYEKTNFFKNVDYYNSEGKNLPFCNDSFDFVYSIRVLNQVNSEDYALQMIDEMIRVCKENGTILIEYVNKNSLSYFNKKGIKLSMKIIKDNIDDKSVKIQSFKGILFFSQTVLDYTPLTLLSTFERIDSFFSKFFPFFSTRCYLIFKKKTGKKIGFYLPQVKCCNEYIEMIGGEIKVGLNTMEILNRNGFQITLITSNDDSKNDLAKISLKNIDLKLLKDISSYFPKNSFNFIKLIKHTVGLFKIIRNSDFDIIHFCGGKNCAYLSAIAKIVRKDCTIYNTITKLNFKKFRHINYILLNKIDIIFTLTEFTKKQLIDLGLSEKKIIVTRPGIDEKWLSSYKKKINVGLREYVLFWRDAEWQNGADICGEVFESLASEFPNIGFVFAIRPNHEYEEYFRKLSSDYDNIKLYVFPYKNFDISDLVKSASIIVLPFRKLSINPQIALLESLSSGNPVITTPIESNLEVVKSGEIGLLVPADITKLTYAIRYALNNSRKMKDIGKLAKEYISFNWNWKNYEYVLLKKYLN